MTCIAVDVPACVRELLLRSFGHGNATAGILLTTEAPLLSRASGCVSCVKGKLKLHSYTKANDPWVDVYIGTDRSIQSCGGVDGGIGLQE